MSCPSCQDAGVFRVAYHDGSPADFALCLCLGWVKGPVSGKLIPAKAHSSEMTREESAYFVDWVIPWAAQNHVVLIPLPKETL